MFIALAHRSTDSLLEVTNVTSGGDNIFRDIVSYKHLVPTGRKAAIDPRYRTASDSERHKDATLHHN